VQFTVENHRDENNATQQEEVGGCDMLVSAFGLTFKTKQNANIWSTARHQQELGRCFRDVTLSPHVQGTHSSPLLLSEDEIVTVPSSFQN
jgi:hypothetical protein